MSKFRFQKLKPNTRRELQKISPLFLSEMAAAPEASPYLDEGVLAIRRPGGLLHEHLLRRVERRQLLRARVLRRLVLFRLRHALVLEVLEVRLALRERRRGLS